MVGIYETPEYIERQRLENEASRRNDLASSEGIAGLLSISGGIWAGLRAVENHGETNRTIPSRILNQLAWINAAVMSGFGTLMLLSSFSGRRKAKANEAELAKLAAVEAVIPDRHIDMTQPEAVAKPGAHVERINNSRLIEQTSIQK